MTIAAGVRIAITGRGVLTPLGDSPAALFSALCAGKTALAPQPELGGVALGAIADFDAARYATIRGMRMYNRGTQLAICATKLALADAKLEPAAVPAEALGVLMASTYGHLDVLIDYDRSLVINGTQRTNAALMPLAIPSAPGAMVALAFGAKAFSMTLSDGGAGSLDALAMGARWLADGRARACIVVTTFSAAPELVRVIARAGGLSASGEVRPFDRAATGTGLGEGAVAFILERTDDAAARAAPVHAELRGYGATFASEARGLEGAFGRAAADALTAAGATPEQLALVSASAAGDRGGDGAEAAMLASLMGARAAKIPVIAIKGALGETFDASGALQLEAALSCLRSGTASPIVGLRDPALDGLCYATRETSVASGLALVTSRASDGTCAALVVSAGDQR